MGELSLRDPLFATWAIAACLMILKVAAMSWLTVIRMMRAKGGFRSREDIRKTILNPLPDPRQLERNQPVERIRRSQMNDLENVPFFLAAGLLYVLSANVTWVARSRAGHDRSWMCDLPAFGRR